MDSLRSSTRSYCSNYLGMCKLYLEENKPKIIAYTTNILACHPFLLLRRQCQVRANSQAYHVTPLPLVLVTVTIIQRKGYKILFKGLVSVILLNVVEFVAEKIMSRLTGLPTEPPLTWYPKAWLQHLLLKSLAVVLSAPFYSASLINTIKVPVPDFVVNKDLKFNKYNFPLSVWQTLLPCTFCRILKYTFVQIVFSFSSAVLYLNLFFDDKKRKICQSVKGGISSEDREDICLSASVFSYLLAETVFYPLETIIHRLILQGTKTWTNDLDYGYGAILIYSAHDGFFDCYDNITWLEGKWGLYKGFGALLLQAFFYPCCIQAVSFTWHYCRQFNKK